jgi:hypothetical protein
MPAARAFARACAKPFSATNRRTSWQVYAKAGVTSIVATAKAKRKVFIIGLVSQTLQRLGSLVVARNSRVTSTLLLRAHLKRKLDKAKGTRHPSRC